MSEPRTQAGRRLLHAIGPLAGNLADILAIEAEAAGLDEDLLLLIAECLVPMAFAVSPDAGHRQARLDAIRRKRDR